MANKAISELPQAQNVNNQDLFVLEQSGIAKKLTAETFITEQGIIDALAAALDGHGGIRSVTLSSVSGRIRTYRITFSDGSATTFQVYDGTSIDRISRTSSSGLDDVYTVFLSDGTTTFFTVRNGADGDVSEATLNSELAKKAPVITETVSSTAIASFADGADDMPIQSLVAEFEPIQDLTYGDPYPAGSGKNLSKPFTYTNNNLVGTTVVYAGDGSCEIDGTASSTSGTPNISTATQNGYTITLPAGTYTISISGQTTNVSAEVYDISTATSLASLTSPTFTLSNETTVLFRCAVSGGSTYSHQKVYMQLESGSSATSYAPYSNICPITGHTEVNVTRTGKNLIDPTSWTTGLVSITVGDDINSITSSTRYNYSNIFPAKQGLVFSIKSLDLAKINFYTVNMYVGSKLSQRLTKNITTANTVETYTVPANTYDLVRINIGAPSGVDADPSYANLQLEYGSTATAYESYQGTTLTVDWTSDAGTVYGGTIDVATGLLTVDRAIVTIDGTGIGKESSTWSTWEYVYYKTVTPTGRYVDPYIAPNIISNQTYAVSYLGLKNANKAGVISFTGNGGYLEWTSLAETLAEEQARLSSLPMQVVYELAAPQTYQLTPQEVIKTLLGTNNVWADTGNVSVTYPADTKMFIENLTQPTEDDLVANQAITSGKYFMVGNSLYLALANIASGAQITIGTNAQRVSLADALNTINS